MADAINTVASKFPDATSRSSTSRPPRLKDKPTNVEGLLFKEQEAGYLAGYLAGLWAKDNNAKVDLDASAARRSRRSTTTSRATRRAPRRPTRASRRCNGYSQDFVDQAKCKEIALDQIAKGSKVVFQVAGGCGLGALDAAKEKGVQGIGVDADQSYLGPHILTSGAEARRPGRVQRDQERPGRHVQGRHRRDQHRRRTTASGIGKIGPAGQKYAAQVKKIQDEIAAGKIKDIPDTVK